MCDRALGAQKGGLYEKKVWIWIIDKPGHGIAAHDGVCVWRERAGRQRDADGGGFGQRDSDAHHPQGQCDGDSCRFNDETGQECHVLRGAGHFLQERWDTAIGIK